MENNTRKFPYGLLLTMVIVSPMLINVAAFQVLRGPNQFAGPLLITGLIGAFIAWVMILADII